MALINVVKFAGDHGDYELTLDQTGRAMKCSCPGFTYRGRCKHVEDPTAYVDTQAAEPIKEPSVSKKSQRQRMTRDEAQPIVDLIVARLDEGGYDYEIGGSWRRRKATVADLDIVIFNEDADGVDLGIEWDRQGPQMCSGDFVVENYGLLQVDVWGQIDRATQRGAFMWFITGPKELNIAMRAAAARKQMMLSQYGLFDKGTNAQLDDGTEEGLAAKLGWKYIEPEFRENWRARR